MLLYVMPVMAASFVLNPAGSFVFAIVVYRRLHAVPT